MEITEIRKQIDETDKVILEQFLTRMKLCEEIAACKKDQALPVFNREREREILARAEENAGPMGPYAYYLFSVLMELSRTRQGELCAAPTKVRTQIEKALEKEEDFFPRTGTVACQGVEGSNGQAACDKLLPRGKIVYVKTFAAVFSAVESGLCKYGVVPIENSTNGSVRSVYELLQKRGLFIVGATNLQIRHELLAKPGVKMEDIKEIYSHEQALGQCSKYLNSLDDSVKITAADNTAAAAKMVAETDRRDCAAIASHDCAALYGLTVINDDIQDSDNNHTRFICVAKEPTIHAGANRISLILSSDNKPGALYGILSKLAVRGINMSKLESCPVTGRNFEYVFFIELEASVKEPGVLPVLDELSRVCEVFHYLGCYASV
ncbi:MAG TPA: prephenate dehydratase [Clostridiales bacterium]|nr:prephenate dehydratase [Clostridiales bacterium]